MMIFKLNALLRKVLYSNFFNTIRLSDTTIDVNQSTVGISYQHCTAIVIKIWTQYSIP